MGTNAGVSNKDHETRMRALQERLGNPQTGYLTHEDWDKLKRLPKLNRDLIEEHYGVKRKGASRWSHASHGPTSQPEIAKRMALKDHVVGQTIRESFALLRLLDHLEAEDMRAELRKLMGRYDELLKAKPTNLDSEARRGLQRTIWRLQEILKNDGVSNDT